jgi:soluble P-type ATPase
MISINIPSFKPLELSHLVSDYNGTLALGNGRNDRLMLQAAALGIALIQREGAAAQTLTSADLVCTSVLDALALLTTPKRLTATLRS